MMYFDDDNRDDLGGNDDDGFVPATNPTKEDYDAVVKQNRRLFARAKKAGSRGAAKTDETVVTDDKKNQPAPNAADDAAWKEKIELKTEGYSDEEVDFIQKNGGKTAKDNAYVKTAIETIRAQKKSEAAQVTDTAGKSEIEKQYTPEQLAAMPLAELEKLLPKAQQ